MSNLHKVKDAGVTLRAILLALILIPLDNYWITVIEVRWYALDGTCLPIFITPIFLLFLLALPNLALKKSRPSLALKRGELLTVYMMIVMGATLASHDVLQNLFGTIGHPHFMANDVNQYSKMFFRYLPEHLFISDPVALTGFYKGAMNPWVWPILRHWIVPLTCWAGLLIVLLSMMMCINIIIRKQWTENEKLVFPLVQLPLAMTAEDSGSKFFGNKLMWAGFSIAVAIGIINGLNVLYPSIPAIQGIKAFDLAPNFPNRPWSALTVGGNGFKIAAYPFAIGLAYFMPLDLSFSCWFFYIARKLWQVFGAVMGWDTAVGATGFPYFDAQSSGAWLALGAVIILSSAAYLKGVWKQAWSKKYDSIEERDENKLYRLSFIGLAVGFVLLLLFSRWIGMSPGFSIIFFLVYFVLAIAITRVRAELGSPHEIYFVNPQQIMVSIFGSSVLGPANLTAISVLYWFNRGYRSHPMPTQLESFKMAEGTAIRIKPLIFALMLATIVGIISTYYANLNVTYAAGGQAKCLGFKYWVGAESFDRLVQWMNNRSGTNITQVTYMAVGAVIVVLLSSMRMAFVNWPFHPAGYALAVSFAMDYFWFAFLVSWFAKLMIVRYGGMKLHNALVPFFLGLILGDFFIGSVWALIGPVIHTQAYRVFI